MSVTNDYNLGSQDGTLLNKSGEAILKILKSLFDFRNIIKLAELVLLMIYKLVYGKQPLFTW